MAVRRGSRHKSDTPMCDYCGLRFSFSPRYKIDDNHLIFKKSHLCIFCLFWGEFHWIETTPQEDLLLAVNYPWMKESKGVLSYLYSLRLSGDTTPLDELLKASRARVDPRFLVIGRYAPISTEGAQYILDRYQEYVSGKFPGWYPQNWLIG